MKFGHLLMLNTLQGINTTTGMRRTTTDRIYDCGPIILYYYNIIMLTIVLQLPTVFSTLTCCAICRLGAIGYTT